jgi:tetratricopeptide (TPR) repeat protein
MRWVFYPLLLLHVAAATADLSPDDTAAALAVAHQAYEAERYSDAVRILEQALAIEPDCARCAHLLGRSYGRLAERANWLAALDLARKTRRALELAVRLAPDDSDAVADLIRYYRAAPGFLGGSVEKARRLEQNLERTATDANS